MIRNLKVIFCDNEHGCGDVTFPDLDDLYPEDLRIAQPTTAGLRKQAREARWKFSGGRDICPSCVECERERG